MEVGFEGDLKELRVLEGLFVPSCLSGHVKDIDLLPPLGILHGLFSEGE